MMQNLNIYNLSISPWIYVPGVYLLWVFILLMFKNFAFYYVRKLISRTPTQLDDLFIRAADFPLTILIFAGGGLVIDWVIPTSGETIFTNYFLAGFKVATIVAIGVFVDRFLSAVMEIYSKKIDILKTSGGIAYSLLRAGIISLGVLILLDSFGVSVTPIIASLGIGSLAVALALQPTLENFFSGIQIVTDQPIQVGHFVKLESGEEGYVQKIGWRSTWIKLPMNAMVIIPNKNLVNTKVINLNQA